MRIPKKELIDFGNQDDFELSMKEEIQKISDRVDRLERIVKYSDTIPTYTIEDKIICGFMSYSQYFLHLYIDKEEYIIELKELEGLYIDRDSIEFDNEEHFIYLSVVSNYHNLDYKKHLFIIEYENKRYIHTETKVKL